MVGEVGVVCNTLQPFTAQVKEVSQLLRVERETLVSVCATYIQDGRQIMENLLKVKHNPSAKKNKKTKKKHARTDYLNIRVILYPNTRTSKYPNGS